MPDAGRGVGGVDLILVPGLWLDADSSEGVTGMIEPQFCKPDELAAAIIAAVDR